MRAFVTGGGGFLGGAIVRLLRARGDDVTSYSRSVHPAIERLGARCVQGDVADRDALSRAMRADIVFHVAAKAGVFGRRSEYFHANVEGTRAVLDAARANGVRRLVFTSSPSVCFDGRDHVMATNELPHATRFLAPYPESKAEAEKLVLAANDTSGLATCALRPHLIFGPGDPHLLPRLIARARAGRLAVVGDGTNEVSLTYVETAARAHIEAADRLHARAVHAGRAYFVSQSEPVKLWPWIGALCRALSIPPPSRRIPLGAAWALGGALEATWRTFALAGEPPMTRFVALQLARSHSYDMRPAERDFGFRESISMARATELTVEALRAPAHA